MKHFEFLQLFAQANRRVGYTEYADKLDNAAVQAEAEEYVKDDQTESA